MTKLVKESGGHEYESIDGKIWKLTEKGKQNFKKIEETQQETEKQRLTTLKTPPASALKELRKGRKTERREKIVKEKKERKQRGESSKALIVKILQEAGKKGILLKDLWMKIGGETQCAFVTVLCNKNLLKRQGRLKEEGEKVWLLTN